MGIRNRGLFSLHRDTVPDLLDQQQALGKAELIDP